MKMPAEGSNVTQEQVDGALDIVSFRGAQAGSKGWHYGQFEPWALDFGYPEGRPLYGDVLVDGRSVHIYYLNDGNAGTIIMTIGKKPQDYAIVPVPKKSAASS